MIAYTRATLDDLPTRAYDLADREQISGPAWLGTEPYDIYAKIPAGTTTEQFRATRKGSSWPSTTSRRTSRWMSWLLARAARS